MSDSTYQSWEEMQRLVLPPNATLLIPPTPEPIEVPVLDSGSPPRPDWLEYGSAADQTVVMDNPAHHSVNPEAEKAAISEAERAKHGPALVRLIANAITMNAVLEVATSPRKVEDEEPKPLTEEPEPDDRDRA